MQAKQLRMCALISAMESCSFRNTYRAGRYILSQFLQLESEHKWGPFLLEQRVMSKGRLESAKVVAQDSISKIDKIIRKPCFSTQELIWLVHELITSDHPMEMMRILKETLTEAHRDCAEMMAAREKHIKEGNAAKVVVTERVLSKNKLPQSDLPEL